MRKWVFLGLVLVAMLISSCVPSNQPPTISNMQPSGSGIQPDEDMKVTLSWSASDPEGDPITYDLYFGESEDAMSQQLRDSTVTSYDVTVEWGKTYYWKVVAKDSAGNSTEKSASFTVVAQKLKVIAKAWNSGPFVEGVSVKVLNKEGDVLSEAITNEKGEAVFDVTSFPEYVNIEMFKDGYAISKVENLKIKEGFEQVKEIPIRKAKLNADPTTQEFPKVSIEYYKSDGTTPLNPETDCATEDFIVHVVVNSINHICVIYEKLGGVPSAFDRDNIELDSNEATFVVNIKGYKGVIPLFVVAYDYNDNRTEHIEYVNIQPEESPSESSEEPGKHIFVPVPLSELGYVNMISYTRNQGIEFYSNDPIVNKIKNKLLKRLQEYSKVNQPKLLLKDFGRSIKAAPENCNLWIEIEWGSYSLFKYFGLIGSLVEKPDGYRIYRSYDGVNYEKIATIPESDDDNDIVYMYRDFSAENEPNKQVWYAVTSYKGDWESEKVYLGSVVPLDSFNVKLIHPEDGAVDVSRNPEFIWEPTNSVESLEGQTEYHYTMWIYDTVQGEEWIVPATVVEDYLEAYDWVKQDAESVVATFTGNMDGEYKWYIEGTYEYPSNKLEAGKTYDWGVDYAYAEVLDEDSLAISIAIDYGWGIDRWGIEPDKHNEFTTGNN